MSYYIKYKKYKMKYLNLKKGNIFKNLIDYDFLNLEYPYRKLEISKVEMLSHFEKLKVYKPIIINNFEGNIEKYNGKIIIFEENYNKNKDLYLITDYFSEKCRVKCIFNLVENKSILDLFESNKLKILNEFKRKNMKLSIYNLREFLYKRFKQCTNFNTTVVLSVLKFFKPKKVLDFSAGWGDRLVGAIAYNCEYLGVDPSNCMKENYINIIDTLCSKDEKKQYQVINDCFENVIIKENYYDLVFTSPPFFELEIYENSEGQSVKKFNSVEKWKKGFLYPSIDKSFRSLKDNGKLALYIADYESNRYVSDMINYIKYKYNGSIYWLNTTNKKKKRGIYVWTKKVK